MGEARPRSVVQIMAFQETPSPEALTVADLSHPVTVMRMPPVGGTRTLSLLQLADRPSPDARLQSSNLVRFLISPCMVAVRKMVILPRLPSSLKQVAKAVLVEATMPSQRQPANPRPSLEDAT